MADQPPDTTPSVGETEDQPPSTPRWVKISGIIVIGLVLLFVIIMLAIGDNHGPGRHLPPPSSEHGIHRL